MADKKIIQSGDLIVTPVLTDRLLAEAYIQMEKEGTLDVVFFQSVPSLSSFLEAHLAGSNRVVLGAFRERQGGDPEFCGLSWIMNPLNIGNYIKAETGICLFRKNVGRDSINFGKMMLESFFTQYDVSCLFGVTPENNKLALRYAQRLGFSMHGPIPDFATWQGKPTGAFISHYSKEEWIERNKNLEGGVSWEVAA